VADFEPGVLKALPESLLVPEGEDVAARGGLAGAQVAGERVVADPREADDGRLVPELDGPFRRSDRAQGQCPCPRLPFPGGRVARLEGQQPTRDERPVQVPQGGQPGAVFDEDLRHVP